MDNVRLATALTSLVGADLASAISVQFVNVRRDCATGVLEKASAGKFVEVFVQCLQQIATGGHSAKPNIDEYLRLVEQQTNLDEGLRICAARAARSIYTLRNKRNVAHIADVDPNRADQSFCHSAAAWIMAELLRNATGISMEEAGELIALVQAPVGTLVEEIGDVRLVLAEVSMRAEILILMHSHYPAAVSQNTVVTSLSRRHPGSVRNTLRTLHQEKLLHGDAKSGYRLTQLGYGAAVEEINSMAA